MIGGYITCPCESYEPGPDGLCTDPECGHDGHQHVAFVGAHEACEAQEGDEPGSYLPFEDSRSDCPELCCQPERDNETKASGGAS